MSFCVIAALIALIIKWNESKIILFDNFFFVSLLVLFKLIQLPLLSTCHYFCSFILHK